MHDDAVYFPILDTSWFLTFLGNTTEKFTKKNVGKNVQKISFYEAENIFILCPRPQGHSFFKHDVCLPHSWA